MRRFLLASGALVGAAVAAAAACVPDYRFSGNSGQDAAPSDAAPAADAPLAPDALAPVDAGVDAPAAVDANAPDTGIVEPAMIPIAGGTYTFTVYLPDGGTAPRTATVPAFALDPYEVTVDRFAAFVRAGMPAPADGQSFDPSGPYAGAMTWRGEWNRLVSVPDYADGGMYDCIEPVSYPCPVAWQKGGSVPVDYINWFQAAAYCAWDGGKRLLTDTEWQVVATGLGADNAYPWGVAPSPSDCTRATLDYDGGECGFPVAVGAASLGATANGVFDMQGSVTEWVWDLGGEGDYPDDAGTAYAGLPLDASPGADTQYVYRHARGGSYLEYPPNAPFAVTNRFLGAAIANSSWGSFGIRCGKSM
jgi:formylglycine-generating enzyme required for sulfatase activity